MSWQDVQQLRKAGQLGEAKQLAHQLLEQNPDDFRISSQLQWVIYDEVKRHITHCSERLKGASALADEDLRRLYAGFRDFTRACPNLPNMAASKLLEQATKIAGHVPRYLDLVRWFGPNGFRPEDWEHTAWQDRQMTPLCVKVARGLAKWCKGRPEAEPSELQYALDWLSNVLPIARGDDALWIQWDRAMLLRRSGDMQEAVASLGAVLKAKRNEFWVWAEAGRLHAEDQPDLALSCFCRALTCPTKAGFAINVHAELAALLAERGEHAQASREVEYAANVRADKGWSIPKELQELIDSPWYDPDATEACERSKYYAKHAPAALALCLDNVQTVNGTYLGTIVPKSDNSPSGRKPRPLPRFAIRDHSGKAWSLVAPGMRVSTLQPGDPVFIVKGTQDNGRDSIVQVSPRADGVAWDCLNLHAALVVRAASEKDRSIHVFLNQVDSFVKIRASVLEGQHDWALGDGLVLYAATNPKRNRLDISRVESGPVPTHRDVQQFSGSLRRNDKGFGFVDSVFVSSPLIEQLPADAIQVTGLAVYKKKPKSEDLSWAAVTVQAAKTSSFPE